MLDRMEMLLSTLVVNSNIDKLLAILNISDLRVKTASMA